MMKKAQEMKEMHEMQEMKQKQQKQIEINITQCNFVMVEEEWLLRLKAKAARYGLLRGSLRDEGEVVQVWASSNKSKNRASQKLGWWLRISNSEPSDPNILQKALKRLHPGQLLLVLEQNPQNCLPPSPTRVENDQAGKGFPSELKELAQLKTSQSIQTIQSIQSTQNWPGQRANLTIYQAWVGYFRQVEYELVRPVTDYAARLKGLFDTAALAAKKVTVVGLGSGGSRAALELAKCGVGSFKLVDFDRLQTANLARHICGVSALGRLKTRAVAEMLREANPNCQVETLEVDILEEEAAFGAFMADSDLVIGATDSEASKLLINRLCWQAAIPSVYGAAYNRAFGGDVVRVIPPETACYYCFQLGFGQMFNEPPTLEAAAPKELDYGTLGEVGKVRGEPGLGLDIGFIALIVARMALHVLLRDNPTTLTDVPTHAVMWGNQPVWLFERPLESIFIELERSPDCPVCQARQYLKGQLELEPEEAVRLTQALIASAPNLAGQLRASAAPVSAAPVSAAPVS